MRLDEQNIAVRPPQAAFLSVLAMADRVGDDGARDADGSWSGRDVSASRWPQITAPTALYDTAPSIPEASVDLAEGERTVSIAGDWAVGLGECSEDGPEVGEEEIYSRLMHFQRPARIGNGLDCSSLSGRQSVMISTRSASSSGAWH